MKPEHSDKRGRMRVAGLLIATSVILSVAGALFPADPEPMMFTANGTRKSADAPEMPNGKVSVNFASLEEIVTLPGIGESIGTAILEERERNGCFHYPEDLLAVRGIGEAKLAGFRDELDLSGTENDIADDEE